MAQCQRSRRENRGWRAWITLAGEDVEDDVGGVDAVGDRLGAGGLNRGQSVGEHCGEDVDHLPIAVIDAGELAPHALHRGRNTQSLNGAPLRRAPGLRASTGT